MTEEETVNYEELLPSVKELREKCVRILNQCQEWNQESPIDGLHRYTNAVTSEMHFLEKLLDNPSLLKKEHVQSTNLGYLEAVFEALEGVGKRKNKVMSQMSAPLAEKSTWMNRAAMTRNRSAKVDIIAENGLVWIKVIARNAKAFRHELMGLEWNDDSDTESESESDSEQVNSVEADFDSLPIFKKAREYLKTAQAHHVQFHTPIVVFAFMRISPDEDIFVQRIMNKLTEIGIIVHLQQPSSIHSTYMPLLKDIDDIDHISTRSINLDVSSSLAILSELSHHVCLPDQVSAMPLKIQAERELKVPALPQIIPYVTGKKLYMIQSAYDRLEEIVNVVGGPNEKARFEYLFRKDDDIPFDPVLWTCLPSLSVQIMPDASSESVSRLLDPPFQNKSKLNNGRKIRTKFSDFHARIFGSGDHYKMTTLSAIQWMETALKDAGVQGTFIVSHEPRSLAEKKMNIK